MTTVAAKWAKHWASLSPRFLPFADVATAELPMLRLLRLSLFQFTVAMSFVLLNGTLNRVMILELGVPSVVVSLMVSIPLLAAPFRALIGYNSDNLRTALGWRRVPFIWFGSLAQFGGLAIMPFALIILSGDSHFPAWVGTAAAALSFLLVGVGMHTTQTAGLALATDLATDETRPRVVAFLYVMLLVGVVISAFIFGQLLANFSQLRLIQVIQGVAVVTMVLNMVALWKQEARDRQLAVQPKSDKSFVEELRAYCAAPNAVRSLVALGLGTAAFNMQDILIEPYGGEVLHLSVGQTTLLTAHLAAGMLTGVAIAGWQLKRHVDIYRVCGFGVLFGLVAFPAVMLSATLETVWLFKLGVTLIGVGSGMFAVGTLTAAMSTANTERRGLALGAWGAVQATAAGLAIAVGGALRDVVALLASREALGPALTGPATGYHAVYHLEILLLFATLIAIGPLVQSARAADEPSGLNKFGLSEFPG